MDEILLEKAKKIKLLLLDVDAVLTDGKIIYDSCGHDMKLFDVHDGMGVYLLKGSRAIRPRARDMRVDAVFENISPKSAMLEKILKKYNIISDEVCFVGDDLVDLCLMGRVGFAVAVFNACPEIKQRAVYITLREGGRGAVREVAELILKAQGKWQGLVSLYDV